MAQTLAITGNHAAAYGAKLSRVQFISAYPITPQTVIVERLAQMVENGELNAKFVRVESEHSALASCIGAAATGLRTFTATSSHGLAYMHEMVIWTAGARLPIVMPVVTRAFAPPWSIWSEHTDLLLERDTGWIVFMAENNQEVLDTIIQAYKIAENENVLLPVMIGMDAFILSHTTTPVEIPDQELVDNFLPQETKKPFILDPNNPITHGSLMYPDWYMEFRYLLYKAMLNAKSVIKDTANQWKKLTGRYHGDLIDCYKCSDADITMITIGASAGDAKEAADILRSEGYKTGVVRLRVLRPFPEEEIREATKNSKLILVVDRNLSPGIGGILLHEIRGAYQTMKKQPLIHGFIAGLGGRDITLQNFISMFKRGYEILEKNEEPGLEWINLKKEVL